MSEEGIKLESSEEGSSEPEVKHSPIQEKALEQGWKPKEQFEGEEDEFIDAAEFVRRGELFGKIEHQGKELKAVRQALEALKQHHGKVAENEYNRALKSLQDSRKQAVLDGEVEKAFAIEDQIDTVKEQRAEAARINQAPAVQELNPEFVAWVDKNQWYSKDKIMRAAADSIGLAHGRAGLEPSEVLKLVEREIKEAFPHKFTNPNRERPSAVEGSSRAGTSVQRSTAVLDEGERAIMRKFVSQGVMTEAAYMAELKRVKGL